MTLHHLERDQVVADPGPRPVADVEVGSTPEVRPSWQSTYRSAVRLTDAGVLAAALITAQLVRFGTTRTAIDGALTYSALAVGIAVAWWAALQLNRSTDRRVLGAGTQEYRRVIHASVMVFGLVAIGSVLFKQDLSRGYLAIAFPLGVVGLLFGRKALRVWLGRRRRDGAMVTNALIIGSPRSARSIHTHLQRNRGAGLQVTGVWVPDQADVAETWLDTQGNRVPVMGSGRDLLDALDASEAHTVVVTDSEHLGHTGLKDLTWALHGLGVELMVSPNVMDVSTPRVTLQTVGNMPFLHVEEPQFEGAARWTKALFDRTIAAAAVLALLPVLAGVALAVRLSSPGKILYRSERIGVGGQPFQMLKFRSMVAGADRMRDDLDSDVDGVLFKQRNDPRVTRVGAILRRYSLDELPQLFNVLRGDMSLVGPRPPLRAEVEQYEGHASRRLLVKQGITGLWQVSGRSDLSWEDTVRLDLDYVENWSLMRDVQIIWRTVRAVVKSDGAY